MRSPRPALLPLHPTHPDRVCWGCDRYCPARDLACGGDRTQHPCELFGDDWAEWAEQFGEAAEDPVSGARRE